jgi:transposase-like protein
MESLPEGVTVTASGKKTYTHAFKLAVVERIKNGEKAADIGNELGVHPTHLRQWARGVGMERQKPETGFVVGPQGKKIYSESFKREAVDRLMSGKMSAAELGRELDVKGGMLTAWRRVLIEGKPSSHASKKKAVTAATRDYKAEYHRRYPKGTKKTQMKGKKQTLTERYSKEALRRLKAGETAKDIGKSLKIDPANIYNWVANSKKQRYVDAGRKGGLAKNKQAKVGISYGDTRKQIEETAPVLSTRMRDAVSLLKHAKTAMYADLQAGKIREFDELHLLVLQALRTLTGE